MRQLVASIKWIMLVSGIITSTMFYAALAPGPALMATFGAALEGSLAEIVVRSWGMLIGLTGVMLIYGAFHPAVRPLVLATAGSSKIVFVALVLTLGIDYLGGPVRTVIMLDTIQAVLCVACLVALSGRGDPATARDAEII